MGHEDPKQAEKNTLRALYGKSQFENGFYISTNVIEAWEDISLFRFKDPKISKQLSKVSGDDGMNYFEQISLVVISPSLMANKDYAYALEDLMTS